MSSIAQLASEVKFTVPLKLHNDLAEILALADHALQEYNTAWATFIAIGDHAAFLAALAAERDREALLAQVGGE